MLNVGWLPNERRLDSDPTLAAAGVVPLGTAMIGMLSCAGAGDVKWSPRVHCTSNFLRTVVSGAFNPFQFKNEYLRLPDVLLLWPATGRSWLTSLDTS